MALSLRTHFVMMASYHRWATRRIFASIRQLEDPKVASSLIVPSTKSSPLNLNPHPFTRDVGMPMSSLYGTLAHIYYGEQIWLCRLNGKPVPENLSALWADSNPLAFADLFNKNHGISPSTLYGESASTDLSSQTPSDSQTANAVRAMNTLSMEIDDQMGDFLTITKGYTEQELAQKVKYMSTTGEEYNYSRVVMLTHFLNHTTHHRGQVSIACAIVPKFMNQPRRLLSNYSWIYTHIPFIFRSQTC